MKKSIITALTIATIALVTPIESVAQQMEQPHIDVQAYSEREVIPNELYIAITINENDYKGKKSLQEMQDVMIDVLKKNGIDVSESLSIDFMGSKISYKLISKRINPKSNAKYTLKLSDAYMMQKVINDLEEKGISNIELTEAKYTKADELKIELGIEAMKKAQKEAQALAGAIEQEIGKAISISSWSSQSGQQLRMYKSQNAIAEEAADEATGNTFTSIPISKLTYRVNVNIRFELK